MRLTRRMAFRERATCAHGLPKTQTTTIAAMLLAGLCGLAAGADAAGLGDALRGQVGGSGGSGTSALGGALGGGANMSALSAMGLTSSGTASIYEI